MKPSDHYQAGECGFCHSLGWVAQLVSGTAEKIVCPACYGSGKFPPVDEQGNEIPVGQ